MIDDEQIISKYIENNSIKKNCQYWNHINTEDQLYLKDKFKHIENIKLSECLYMILHHLDNRPLCPICNKRNIAINNKLNYYEIFPININDMKIKLEKIIRKIDNL